MPLENIYRYERVKSEPKIQKCNLHQNDKLYYLQYKQWTYTVYNITKTGFSFLCRWYTVVSFLENCMSKYEGDMYGCE
jgi:hypothetical protein